MYRNLKSLVESGVLKVVEIPGTTARYELANLDEHNHFQCNDCDKVYDIPSHPEDLEAITPPGFEVEAHNLTLYGTCPECK